MSAPEVAPAGDRRVVSRVLAAAFDTDPVLRWLRPHGSLLPLLTLFTRIGHGHPAASDLCRLDGVPVGASLWDPPGWSPSPWLRRLTAPLSLAALGPAGAGRGAQLHEVVERARPGGAYLYLGLLGATVTGRGVGSALLAHRLAGWAGAAYLESSNEANLPLYERFGFEVLDELRLPDGGPALWPMLRPPA